MFRIINKLIRRNAYVGRLFSTLSKHKQNDAVTKSIESIDYKRLSKYFKNDFRDDWYPDPISFEDFLNESFEQCLKDLFSDTNELPIFERELLNLPKKGFTLRYSLETPYLNRFIYSAIVSLLMPHYDKLLSPRVLNHRYQTNPKTNERYLFKHPIESWATYEGFVRDSLKNGDKVLLETDLVNYFENISASDVVRIFREYQIRINNSDVDYSYLNKLIDRLSESLNLWCYKNGRGIPQNRDASSFLANMLMSRIDDVMINHHGYDYYRYMDDIKIVCDDEFAARKALKLIINELRKYGLNVNSSKTNILKPGDDEYEKFMSGSDLELEQIDALWKTRSKPSIIKSFEILKSYTLKLINNGLTQERGFRFSLKRLENLALCEDIVTPKKYFDEITNCIIDELHIQPYSSDQFVRYLSATELDDEQLQGIKIYLTDEKKAIYGWQNYLLWLLFIIKEYKDEELINFASSIINNKSSAAGNMSGASLYIGAFGTTDQKNTLISNFKNISSNMAQRAALIALQDIPFSPKIKTQVVPYVNEAARGTYRRVKDNCPGRYCTKPESIPYKSIYDELIDDVS